MHVLSALAPLIIVGGIAIVALAAALYDDVGTWINTRPLPADARFTLKILYWVSAPVWVPVGMIGFLIGSVVMGGASVVMGGVKFFRGGVLLGVAGVRTVRARLHPPAPPPPVPDEYERLAEQELTEWLSQ
jgi:hypothetical protein